MKMQTVYTQIVFCCCVVLFTTNAHADDKNTSNSTAVQVPTVGIRLNTQSGVKTAPSSTIRKDLTSIGKNAAAARNAKDINHLQQMENINNGAGAAALNRNRRSNDPAAGTALGGHTFERNNPSNSRNRQGGFSAQGCRTDPAKCISSGTNRQHHPSAQPSSPAAGVTTHRGWAEGDGTLVNKEHIKNQDGTSTTIYTYDRGNGSQTEHWVNRNSNGEVTSKRSRTTTVEVGEPNPQGERPVRRTEVLDDGTKIEHWETPDPDGDLEDLATEGTRPDVDPAETNTVRGQPREDGYTNSNNDCNWVPGLGCTNKRASKQDMTSQPGRTDSGSGQSATPRLGREAVTNSGDATYNSAVQRGVSGGKPIDMKDPGFGPGGALPGPGGR